MKLRQTLAMGAVSALLAPAVIVAAASTANADVFHASLTVDAPKVLGVGGKAVEFNADIKGLDDHGARLYFTLELGDYFKTRTGEYDADDLRMEWFDPAGDHGSGGWGNVALDGDGKTLTGKIRRTFSSDTTVKLKLSVAEPERADGPATKAKAQAGRKAAKQLQEQAEAREGKTLPGLRPCDNAKPAFTLTSDLRSYEPVILRAPGAAATATSSPKPPASEPTASPDGPLATDVDKVKVGVPAVDLRGLDGDVVAGGQAKKFTAVLCNPTDSAYDNVALGLFFGRLDDVTGTEKDLTLDHLVKGTWSPVELKAVTEDDESLLATIFVDGEGNGVALPARAEVPNELRITAGKAAKLGAWGSVGVAELLDSDVEGGFDRADFRVVAPGSAPSPTPAQPAPVPDDLAETGGNVTVGLVGACLLVLGGGAVYLTRRRRQTAA
jgi:LPXTG-motif cell wall-anchored protein